MTLSAEDLGSGFGEQAARWAQRAGASAAHCELARHLAAALSLAVADGHTCLRLVFDDRGTLRTAPNGRPLQRDAVLATCIVGEAHAPGGFPLVLDAQGRLYLHRYFDYERRLARRLLRIAEPCALPQPAAAMRTNGQLDLQRLATALALQRRFTLISGGPGTGKTSTVVQLLGALLTHAPAARIVLAAPTGKAAARMQEALRRRAFSLPAALQAALPQQASTIHRLLGADGRSGQFHHHAQRRLALDVLVVDEASMLDLALAAQLFDALPDTARVILLGDKDQLAAVESGAVFAELSAQQGFDDATCVSLAAQLGVPAQQVRATLAPAGAAGLDNSVVWLRQQFRFAADSLIGRLAAAVRDGDVETALSLCHGARVAGVGAMVPMDTSAEEVAALQVIQPLCWMTCTPIPAVETRRLARQIGDPQPAEAQLAALFNGFQAFFDAVQAGDAPAQVFAAFDTFRVLCAVRSGPWGAAALTEIISGGARALVDAPDEAGFRSAWYRGRPVMVMHNDPVLNLFNGDIGIALVHPDEGELQVCFLLPDDQLRWVAPVRLPPHETAFAMTIHKSQGSEFTRVAVVLPPQPSPVLTRELLYTGVTRARDAILLVADAERLRDAVQAPTVRDSGLLARIAEALAGAPVSDTPPGSAGAGR